MPMAKFTPTEEQREDVATMSAGRLSQEEIAKSIINPRTGRGISVKVLRRLFKKELAEDTELKKEIIAQYRECVRERQPWAIKLGMENIVGFADAAATATATSGNDAMTKGITVRFIASPHANEPRPAPLDVTPKPSWPQNLRQLEAPRERPTIDSTEEGLIRPLAQEQRPSEPPPFRSPYKHVTPGTRDGWIMPERPVGDARTEFDIKNFWRGPTTMGPPPPKNGGRNK